MKLKDAVRTLLFKNKIVSYNQLYTKWGEELNTSEVLTEYPRPQLKRNNYTILNGYWDYKITKAAAEPEVYDGKILVPFSPESVLSGVNRQLKPEEFLWYRRQVNITDIPAGKRCILNLGAVDQFCEIFVNNKKAAEHMGGYLPFAADITEYVITGDNTVTIKVTDVSDTSFHSRGKQKLKRGGMYYTAQSGIWQTVWYEWVPDIYITSLGITPDFDSGSVNIMVNLNRKITDADSTIDSSGLGIRVDLYSAEGYINSLVSRTPELLIGLDSFTAWTPEQPYLYKIVVYYGADEVESYFAMRKLEIRKDSEGIARIFLNNKPYFMKGLLDQGYWPDGLYTAPSDEAFIFDITEAKKLGFNMLRKHAKIEPLRYYYHCDRLGMIVWQDIVNGGSKYNMLLVGYLPTIFPGIAGHIKDSHYRLFGRKDAGGREEWTDECRETVKLLYNSPSVAAWVPFNEGWGQFDAVKIHDMIKEIDPHRLIDHASGWYDQGAGDFSSIHNYFHPLKVKPCEKPAVLSEFGGYACYIPNHAYSLKIYGYRIYLTTEELNEAFHKLMDMEITKLYKEGLSAAVYTQLSDVEDEVNGLFTYDRKLCKVTGQLSKN